MSTSLGRIVMNTRERGVSNDITRLQDLIGQDLMEIFRGLEGFHTNPNSSTASEDRDVVLRGMAAVPGAGLSIDVQEGYATIIRNAGAPSADDSAYRLCHNRATQNLTLAAADAVNPRYDLIEATFSDDLTESQNRDIYNPVTGLFAPAAVDKVRRAGCVLTVTTGTAAANPVIPAFSAAATDRIPIAAVRVPALAASIAASDILDMRPLAVPAPMARMHGVVDGLELTTANALTDVTTLIVRQGSAVVDGQFVNRASQSLVIANIVEAGVSLAANTWYYVYLFASRDGTGFRPRMTQIGAAGTEGIIVLSDKVPTKDGRPTSAVAFPTAGGPSYSMFGGDSSTRGCYLGAVKTGAVATELRPFFRDNNWIRRNRHVELFTAGAVTGSTETINLESAGDLPASCRAVEAFIKVVFTAGSAEQSITVRPSGAASGAHEISFGQTGVTGQNSIFNTPTFVMSFDATFQQIDVVLAGTIFDTTASVNQFVVIGMYDPVPRAAS